MHIHKYIKATVVAGALLMLGFTIDEGRRFLGAGNRPANGGFPVLLVPVRFGSLAASSDWITRYEVFFAPLVDVRSDSTYGVLVFVSKVEDKAPFPAEAGDQPFDLVGVDDTISPFFLDPSKMAQAPSRPVIVMLDFFQSPSRWSEEKLLNTALTIRSP